MNRLVDLYRELSYLKDEIIESISLVGFEWYLSDEYSEVLDEICIIEFEIELLELLSSEQIKN